MQASPLPPAEFVAKAQAKGFVFSVKPGDQLAVKPPASGVMTDSIRRYVRVMKAELLELLRATNPDRQKSITVPGAFCPSHRKGIVGHFPTPGVLSSPLFPDQRQKLINWAVSELYASRFLEPAEPIALPSGASTGDCAADWFYSAYQRAQELLQEPGGAEQQGEFYQLAEDLLALASWAAAWVRWNRLTITHAGAGCRIPQKHGMEKVEKCLP